MKKTLSYLLALLTALSMLTFGSFTVSAAEVLGQTEPEGSGTAEDPFLITSAENLQWMSRNCGRDANGNPTNSNPADAGRQAGFQGMYFRQTQDIDLGGKTLNSIGFYSNGPSDMSYASATLFQAFSGIYDGQGYKISNGYVRGANGGSTNKNWGCGVFGAIYGAVIQNVTLDNIQFGDVVTGNAGLLVSMAIGSSEGNNVFAFNKILNCTVLDTCVFNIPATVNGGRYGAIVGSASGTYIENCVNYASVTTGAGSTGTTNVNDHCYTGGIIGAVYNACDLVNCINNGNITSNNVKNGHVGGIAGFYDAQYATGKLYHLVNTGNVTNYATSYSDAAGILAKARKENYGTLALTFDGCVNTGNITSPSNCNVAGIASDLSVKEHVIQNCVVGGTVTSTNTTNNLCLSAMVGWVNITNGITVKNNLSCVTFVTNTTKSVTRAAFFGHGQQSVGTKISGNRVLKNGYDCSTQSATANVGYAFADGQATEVTAEEAQTEMANAVKKIEDSISVSAINYESPITALGTQISKDKTNIRIVFGINGLNYENYGVSVAVVNNESGIPDSGKSESYTSTKVFRSVRGYDENGEEQIYEAKAFGENFLAAVNITGFPTTGDAILMVTGFTNGEGYAAPITIIFKDGELVSARLGLPNIVQN